MMATTMSANVFFWIIPGQRKVVAALRAGQPVDPMHGQRGKQRSVHNTYFTLPVVFTMLSNHYGFVYGATAQLARAGGADARRRADPRSFVLRHKALAEGRPVPWRYAAIGTLVDRRRCSRCSCRRRRRRARRRCRRRRFAEVQAIVEQRCQLCHNAQVPSKNVRLDSPEAIVAQAQAVHQQAVVLKVMPMDALARLALLAPPLLAGQHHEVVAAEHQRQGHLDVDRMLTQAVSPTVALSAASGSPTTCAPGIAPICSISILAGAGGRSSSRPRSAVRRHCRDHLLRAD